MISGLSEDIVRQRLRRAIMARDRNDLQKAIDDYYNSSLPSKGNRDLLVAERLLEIAILRDGACCNIENSSQYLSLI